MSDRPKTPESSGEIPKRAASASASSGPAAASSASGEAPKGSTSIASDNRRKSESGTPGAAAAEALSASGEAPKGSTSIASDNRRKSESGTPGAAAAEALSATHSNFLDRLSAIQQNAVNKHQNLLQNHINEYNKLHADIISADPTAAFLSDLLRAYRTNDAGGIIEAYASLTNHSLQIRSTAERRLRDLIKSYRSETDALGNEYYEGLVKEGKDYSRKVSDAIKEVDFEGLDPNSKSMIAHGLLVGAVVQSTLKP